MTTNHYNGTFGSLVTGGFFSSNPDDLHVPRPIRTNNPGALNISQWQRARKGFVGVTFPDNAGNVTAVYRTPEHGCAAWYNLLSARYGFARAGIFSVLDLAEHYAGAETADSRAVRGYCAGWNHAAGGALPEDREIRIDEDGALLVLARAMFAHEAGRPSPVHDNQILFALDAERGGTLPA